jgi:tetratricopeptide (TPR) repeat protein
MRHIPLAFAAFLCTTCGFVWAQEFDVQLKEAWAKLRVPSDESNKLMIEGDLAGAKAKLLTVFPEKDRSAAESFLLGNLLFEVDRKLSYSLHKAAAEKAQDNAIVVWEWALQQHRAGEYAGALKSYQVFSKTRPDSAAAYALQADCLLQLNKTDEAIKAWQQSEHARVGTIEQMESLVCTVNRDAVPFAKRVELLTKATRKADADAAAELIALDCAFPFDWWNTKPYDSYLAHDLPAVLAALKLPASDVRVRAMNCAAACAQADQKDAGALKRILAKHNLLIDVNQTLPANPGLLHVILTAAYRSKALDEKALRTLSPKVQAIAAKSKDARAWSAASVFIESAGPEEQIKYARDAWKATGDAHFAALVLFLKQKRGKLAGNDAELLAALKQFPESCDVQRANVEVAAREKKLSRDMLAAAAKAEFRHFSSFVAPATVVNRPRADYLRSYFTTMGSMTAGQGPGAK